MEDQEKIVIEYDEEMSDGPAKAKKTVRVLSFRLGNERYAIKIAQAKEVFKLSVITRVPNMPIFIQGITNLHGDILPVLDIRYFLGLPQKEGLGGTKAIATDLKASPMAVIVDGIDEALDVEEDAIQPPLATIKGNLAIFTIGQVELKGEIIVLLDLNRILSCSEIENLKKGV